MRPSMLAIASSTGMSGLGVTAQPLSQPPRLLAAGPVKCLASSCQHARTVLTACPSWHDGPPQPHSGLTTARHGHGQQRKDLIEKRSHLVMGWGLGGGCAWLACLLAQLKRRSERAAPVMQRGRPLSVRGRSHLDPQFGCTRVHARAAKKGLPRSLWAAGKAGTHTSTPAATLLLGAWHAAGGG